MKQISINFKKSYISNENIYQYNYLIYNLKIIIEKIELK